MWNDIISHLCIYILTAIYLLYLLAIVLILHLNYWLLPAVRKLSFLSLLFHVTVVLFRLTFLSRYWKKSRQCKAISVSLNKYLEILELIFLCHQFLFFPAKNMPTGLINLKSVYVYVTTIFENNCYVLYSINVHFPCSCDAKPCHFISTRIRNMKFCNVFVMAEICLRQTYDFNTEIHLGLCYGWSNCFQNTYSFIVLHSWFFVAHVVLPMSRF